MQIRIPTLKRQLIIVHRCQWWWKPPWERWSPRRETLTRILLPLNKCGPKLLGYYRFNLNIFSRIQILFNKFNLKFCGCKIFTDVRDMEKQKILKSLRIRLIPVLDSSWQLRRMWWDLRVMKSIRKKISSNRVFVNSATEVSFYWILLF